LCLRSIFLRQQFTLQINSQSSTGKKKYSQIIVENELSFFKMLEILLQFCYNPIYNKRALTKEELDELQRLNELYQVIGFSDCLVQYFKTEDLSNNKWFLNSTVTQEEMVPALISDITFLITDKEFLLHKAIIGSRSLWFEALCVKGSFKEASQPVIKILKQRLQRYLQ